MASWCVICRYKVKDNYIYYKGQKVHKACKNNLIKTQRRRTVSILKKN